MGFGGEGFIRAIVPKVLLWERVGSGFGRARGWREGGGLRWVLVVV